MTTQSLCDKHWPTASIAFATFAWQGKNPSHQVPAQSTTAALSEKPRRRPKWWLLKVSVAVSPQDIPLDLLAVIKSEYSDNDMMTSELWSAPV